MSTSTRLLPHRLLLVDDDADERDAIASFLELEGAEVAVAGDGEEALDALQADPSRCLILLDLQMPGMNGWEFRRRQLLSSMARIPVVVVSGLPDLAAAIRGMSARAALRKPVELELLLGAVDAHCGGHLLNVTDGGSSYSHSMCQPSSWSVSNWPTSVPFRWSTRRRWSGS